MVELGNVDLGAPLCASLWSRCLASEYSACADVNPAAAPPIKPMLRPMEK